jgi:hypothetical protein
MPSTMHARHSRALELDLPLERSDVLGGVTKQGIVECIVGEDACGQPAAQVTSHAVRIVCEFVRDTDADQAILLGSQGPEIGRLTTFGRELTPNMQGWAGTFRTYLANGPLAMQPPPNPEGICNPPEPVDPLWRTNRPSEPMLVSDPSKTGDSLRLSWCENQFQY